MQLLISDANILIDIDRLELIKEFYSLPHDIQTTDFAFAELYKTQRAILSHNRLTIIPTPDGPALDEISDLFNAHAGISFQDASVWYYARTRGGVLLTGDGTLRKKAMKDGVTVRGILFILDELKAHGIISIATTLVKLQLLQEINTRLPEGEIQQRIARLTDELKQ